MPMFTVAIPTYNRAHYLPDTLACLLRQTYQDFEVLISDNGSTDNTSEVVRQFNDKRIRYVRHATNLGPAANWVYCAEQARTDWFVYNQDDDLLCPLFLERCARAISQHPDIVMYATDILHSADVSRISGATFGGFPLKHRWDLPQPRLIPGEQVAALNWFMTGFMPPAQAFLTRLLVKHFPRGEDAVQQGDHYLTSHVACEGTVAYESCVGAILRHHPQRLCVVIQDAWRRSRELQSAALHDLFAEKNIDWQSALRTILPDLSLEFREETLLRHLGDGLLPQEVLAILTESIAAERKVNSAEVASQLKEQRLKAVRGGRLDRLGLPTPMVHVLRRVFSALGKRY